LTNLDIKASSGAALGLPEMISLAGSSLHEVYGSGACGARPIHLIYPYRWER